jgi:hypothetical protein
VPERLKIDSGAGGGGRRGAGHRGDRGRIRSARRGIETMTNGEIGWNHDFKHPSNYPISMFTSGRITDDQAAGRVYCPFSHDLLHLVWTQDDGRLLAELTGAPDYDAYVWWRQVHHSIVLPGYPGMSMP